MTKERVHLHSWKDTMKLHLQLKPVIDPNLLFMTKMAEYGTYNFYRLHLLFFFSFALSLFLLFRSISLFFPS